jgi:hypothetical protein
MDLRRCVLAGRGSWNAPRGRKVWVFGAVARGGAGIAGDIDLLVSMEPVAACLTSLGCARTRVCVSMWPAMVAWGRIWVNASTPRQEVWGDAAARFRLLADNRDAT